MPGAAQRGLGGIGAPDLVPNFTEAARQKLKQANAAWADLKDRFAKGSVGNVLQSDSRTQSGYRVPDSMVPSTLFQKGPKGAEAADQLIKAVGQDGALQILGDYPAYSLRAKAEDMGVLNAKKYAEWAADHAPILDKFPELKASFDTAAKASAVLDDLKAQRKALDLTDPLAKIQNDADVMKKYVTPGASGYENAERLVRDTNGSPDALKATRDHLSELLRDEAEVKSGPNAGTVNPAAYDKFMARYEPFLSHPAMADVKSSFESVGQAQQALDAVAAEHRAALDAYQKSVARYFLPDDTDPVRAVGKMLNGPNAATDLADLGRQTAADPVAREAVQKAVVEHMLDVLKSNRPIAGDITQTALKGEATQNFMRKFVGENGDGMLRHVMTPEQMDALNKVALDVRRSNMTVPMRGSDTGLITSAHRAGEHNPTILGLITYLETVGEAAQHALGPMGKVGAMLGAVVLNGMRKAGFTKVADLQAEALLHPDRLLALYARLPTESEMPSRIAAIRSQLLGLSALGAARSANQNEQRSAAR